MHLEYLKRILYLLQKKIKLKYKRLGKSTQPGLFCVIISLGGASVRRIVYSWWKSNMVIPSKEPLVNLGTKIVRLGLSVDKQEFEP